MLKKDDSIFIDENGKEWEKLLSKDYVVIGNIDTFTSTATLFYSDHKQLKCKGNVDEWIYLPQNTLKEKASIYFSLSP